MKRTAMLCALGLMVLTVSAKAADPGPRNQMKVVWTAPDLPLRVPMLATRELTAPGIRSQPGQLLVLRLQVRLDAEVNSGWNKFLELEINGRPVTQTLGGARNGPPRVINRDPGWFPKGYRDDYVLFADNRLNVVFAPDFEHPDRRLATEGDEVFWYVLDVGDLISWEAGNVIRFTNTAQPMWFEGQQHEVVIGDVSLGYLPASSRPAGMLSFARPLPIGQTVTGEGFSLTLAPEGGMAIQVGDEHYLVETSLTWPRGDLNWLACADRLKAARPQEWRIVRASLSRRGGRVVAEGAHYRLTRQLRFDGPRVRVSDRLDNLTGDDLGVHLSYEVSAGGAMPVLYLSGDGSPSTDFLDEVAANPTIFTGQARSGLGWLAEDDVLRVQLRLRNLRGSVSAYTPGLGIPARGSYTVRWTLYPSRVPDYWSFINQVRRDWDVNFTIDGPFAFLGQASDLARMTPDDMRTRLDPRRVRLAAIHPWTAYQYPYSREDHRNWWREVRACIHAVDPAVKTLVLMEPPLESRVHKDHLAEDPYRDSIIINRDGQPGYDLGYGPNYVGQADWEAGYRLIWRYPTLSNSWLQYLLADVKFAMEDCGAEGMYIDCFSYAFNRNWARYTFDRWDGHTVDLDPDTHVITAKYADAALLSSPAQQRIVEAIQAAGGVVVANTEPATAEMREVRCNRFVETGSGQEYDRGTHLYTPIALGTPWSAFPESARNSRGFMADVVANLRYGAVYYYYSIPASGLNYGFINRMFPFTPRELHAGWLVGEERIITTEPGQYGWGDRSEAVTYHYDLDGAETVMNVKPRVVDGANVYDLKLQPGEIVIMERKR